MAESVGPFPTVNDKQASNWYPSLGNKGDTSIQFHKRGAGDERKVVKSFIFAQVSNHKAGIVPIGSRFNCDSPASC